MNTFNAFLRGEAARGNTMRVFDWDKAAELIRDRKPQYAAAGLLEDWEWTGGVIYEDGKIVTTSYTYLASTWATPELYIDGEAIPCWVWETETKYNSDTKWPKSARDILYGTGTSTRAEIK